MQKVWHILFIRYPVVGFLGGFINNFGTIFRQYHGVCLAGDGSEVVLVSALSVIWILALVFARGVRHYSQNFRVELELKLKGRTKS